MPAAATARLKAFCRLQPVSGPIGPPALTPRRVAGNSHGRERCVVQNSRSNFSVRSAQRHVPVLAALSMNVEKHPARIDVGYLKMGAFPQTQSTAVDGFQTGAIDGSVHLLQNPVHFLPAQDDGQFLLRTWPDKPQRGPVALEC